MIVLLKRFAFIDDEHSLRSPEDAQRDVLAWINDHVDPANILSITEMYVPGTSGYVITVWYLAAFPNA